MRSLPSSPRGVENQGSHSESTSTAAPPKPRNSDHLKRLKSTPCGPYTRLGRAATPSNGRIGSRPQPDRRRDMAVVKVIELIGTLNSSIEDAVQSAVADAKTTLRNIKAVDIVSTGLRGENLD